VIANR
jgi:hypothetical protein